jgi:hypothetical protein
MGTNEMSEAKKKTRAAQLFDELQDKRNDLRFFKENILRTLGWESRCDFPGGLWLWCKTINGENICVDLDCAISIEEYPL